MKIARVDKLWMPWPEFRSTAFVMHPARHCVPRASLKSPRTMGKDIQIDEAVGLFFSFICDVCALTDAARGVRDSAQDEKTYHYS